jgi:hypothetical protein
MGKFFKRTEIFGAEKHIDALLDYLEEELSDMNTLQRGNWNFASRNAGKGVIIDMVKEIDPKRGKELVELVNNNEDVSEYIEKNRKELEFVLNKYINRRTSTNKKMLVDNLLIEEDGNEFTNYGLPINKETVTDAEVNTFIKEFTVNNLIANIEQVKLLSGNPMLYKTVEDQFKRNSGQVGTKKISIVSKYMNTWIKEHMDSFGLAPFTNAIRNGQPILKTAIFADVKTMSAELDSYRKIVGNKAEKYDEMDEGDAQGYIHLSEYRRMLMRAGDWTFGKGSLEEIYQQQIGRNTYLDPKSGEELFPINAERVSKIVFNALKPQHFGPLAEGFNGVDTEGFIPGFYKLSVMPILPKVAEQFPNLNKLNKQMELQETGLVVFASGNKVGTKLDKNGAIQPVYNNEGKFNFSESNKMVTQDTYYKYWGIQVDMGNKSKKQVIWGTQMAKQVINALTEFGEAKNPEAAGLLSRYLSLNNQRIQFGFNELLEKFGLEYNKSGELISKNPQQLIDTLKERAIADNMPDNILRAIEDINEYGIDIAPNRKKLEQVLMAMADKIVISQKTFGAPLVQVANTFFEKSGVRQVVKKNKNGKEVSYFQSNELKSYGVETDSDGNITKVKSMQVMIPAIYKGIIEVGKVSPELKRLIGFRIPTQGLNSIESLEIVGFLPEEVGDIIVLPTEIVAKAGSDFDIDKLNVFLPNVARTKKGIQYIKNNRTQWETYQLEGILDNKEDKLLTWEQWQKRGVENELMEVMHSIITSPMNAQQLLSPNQVDPLKDTANYIDYLEWKKAGKWKGSFDKSFSDALKAENDATPYNRIVDLDYQMDLAERFLGGKSAIGITAVHSTFHILSQMNNLFIKPSYRVEEKVREGRKLVTKEVDMPTKINMEHNTDESNNILLGGLTSKDGSSIVDELSMWINAAVDAARDPFMFKLNAGPQTLNVVLFLAMSGVGRRSTALFMNQPIIKRYLELQRKYESIMADSTKANKGKKYKNEIEDMVLNEMGLSKFDWNTENTTLNEGILEREFLNPSKLQAQILSDFMRYQEVAKVLREAVQSATYDTAGAGKTTSELGFKLQTTDYILAQELIGNYDKLLNSGFIAPYYQKAKDIQNIMKEFVPHLKSPIVVDAFKEFMSRYIQPHVNMKTDDIISAIEKFKEDLLVYVVMTINNNATQTNPLQNEFDRLFKGDKSMANRISELQKKYPRNTLLANLLPIFNSNTKGINNAKMYITKLETIESNQLTEDWRALYEGGEREFAKDLIKFIIIQSGLNNSPLNFINLAPHEYYAEIMNSVTTNMSTLTADQLKDFGGDTGQFWLHHRNDKTIVPTRKTKGFPYYRSWSTEAQSYTVFRVSDGKAIAESEMPILDFKNNSTAKMYGLLGVTNQVNENTQVEDRSKKNLSDITIEEVYSQLGDKTVSENVVIESWGRLKDKKEAIIRDETDSSRLIIISTRILNSNEHFGNPFSSDEGVLKQNPSLIKTNSTKESVEKYIDWAINSQDTRAKWIREQLQSGELKGNPILYYKELGQPSHATALDYLINKYDWRPYYNKATQEDFDILGFFKTVMNISDAEKFLESFIEKDNSFMFNKLLESFSKRKDLSPSGIISLRFLQFLQKSTRLDSLKFKIVDTVGKSENDLYNLGAYYSKENMIVISKDNMARALSPIMKMAPSIKYEGLIQTILHEVVHSVTAPTYLEAIYKLHKQLEEAKKRGENKETDELNFSFPSENPYIDFVNKNFIDFANKMTKLYDFAKEHFKNDDSYGFTGIAEFVSEAVANPVFQKKLAAVKYMNTNQSIFDKFITFLSEQFEKLIGHSIDNTLLKEVLNTVATVMTVNEKNPTPYHRSKGMLLLDVFYEKTAETAKTENNWEKEDNTCITPY